MGPNSFKSSFATWKEKHISFNRPHWSFKTLSRPLLHLFGIYPELSHLPALMECPTEPVSVVYWDDYLRRSTISGNDTFSGPAYRQRMESMKVLELLRKKERSGVKHEYFAVKIDHPECGIRYIRIERAGGDVVDSSPDNSSSTTLSEPSSSSKPRVAKDSVTSIKSLPDNDKTIEKAVAKHIRLVDIAIAAKIVHDHDERYRVFKGQCFWFSDMIMRVLENYFINPDVDGSFVKLRTLGPDLEQEDAYAPNWQAEVLSKEGGKVSHIPIYSLRKADVKDLSEVFKKVLEDCAEKVQAEETKFQEMANVRERAKLAERLQEEKITWQEERVAFEEKTTALEEEKVTWQEEKATWQEERAAFEEEIARLRANQQAGPSRRR
ncbi:hypothetical protein BU17DRAFT_98604 [Hysterangium stoloniferum]|nr:hypothetical protein BU17DRAFT_98604 [Hysterangium stoloniferum]